MSKYDEVKAAALAATPGPWEYREESFDYSIRQAGSTIKYSGCEEYTPIAGDVTGEMTAVFIAAASPDVVLSLLAALEEKDQAFSAERSAKVAAWNEAKEQCLRADAAEKRETHLKADAAVLAQRNKELAEHNAELEQRLQQPIKLPKREIGVACEFVSDHIVVSLAAVLVEAATSGFKAEIQGGSDG